MTDIHDMVTQLTSGHTHRQPFTVANGTELTTHYHRTYTPALLDQLETATQANDGTNGTGGPKSRPAAWIEPLDTIALIDFEAARWIRVLGHDDPTDTKACVRKLHGLHPSQDEPTRTDIERSIRSWWTQARVVTGWDSPAWRPDNTCPICSERRTLRIKLADQMGFCTECRETWDAVTIGLLADHIRLENAEDDAA